MIGNDIVDITLARESSNWNRPRYLDKLFNSKEQSLIKNARDPELQLWLLWACKEAAYKAWSAVSHLRKFAPKSLSITDWQPLTSGRYRATVHTEQQTYLVTAQATRTYVRAFTKVAPFNIAKQEILFHPDLPALDWEPIITNATQNLGALHLACAPDHISIQKNELGRPILYYQNEPSGIYLSWAHHGEWAEIILGAPPQ